MKKEILKEVMICDCCKKEAYLDKCLGCGQEFCWECREKLGITYHAGVHFSGSGNGFFCSKCNINPSSEIFQLWLKYRQIQSLKNEESGFYEEFSKRSKKAEEELKILLNQKGGK